MRNDFKEEARTSPHLAFTYADLYSIYLKWVARVNGPIECEGTVVLPAQTRVIKMEKHDFENWVRPLPTAEIASKVELWETPRNGKSEDDLAFEAAFLDNHPSARREPK